jgi:hypothetical protein
LATVIDICFPSDESSCQCHTGLESPQQILTRQPEPDISKFLHFSFYAPVYYHVHVNTFPSTYNEEQGWWVGIATHVGDVLTYKILTKQNKVIYWSAIWSALDPTKRKQCLSPLGGETVSTYLGDTMYIRSSKPSSEPNHDEVGRGPNVKKRIITIDLQELIGRTFLKDAEEDVQRFCVCVVHAVVGREEELKKGSGYMKFICEIPNSIVDEIFTYNEILITLRRIRVT